VSRELVTFVINAEARADLDAGRKEIDGIHFR
jgi:hypothetical protein